MGGAGGLVVEFRVLGPIEVLVDGEAVPVGGAHQRALLAILVIHRNTFVSVERLIEMLLEREASTAAKRAVHTAVSRLRGALGATAGACLTTRSGGYVLRCDVSGSDVAVFERCLAEGRQRLSAGDPELARGRLSEGLAMWRGDAFADAADLDIIRAEARRLAELRLDAFEARIDGNLTLGRQGEVMAELQRLVGDHPTRERLIAQLMVALYRCDRQAEALEVYAQARRHLAEDLGLEPSSALTDLQIRILRHSERLDDRHAAGRDPASGRADAVDGVLSIEGVDRPRAPTRPPNPPIPMIGRDREVGELRGLLDRGETRLVTLVGPGGVGKTRLALEIAHTAGAKFSDGVCWVELAGASRWEEVRTTLARALPLAVLPDETVEDAVVRYLSNCRLLLVMDNFEHVLPAATLVSELHAAAPGLVMLVTSREALDVTAEQRFAVAPLAVPGSEERAPAQIEATPASAAFLAAARRRAPLSVTAGNAMTIAGICRQLDGLPLALELAAARTAAMTVDELADELTRSPLTLGAGSRDMPARHRALHATVRWSVDLLAPDELAAFTTFAVFTGGATLDAATVVCATTRDTLDALLAKSLLQHAEHADATTRLLMLETIRAYAQPLLLARADHGDFRRRHLHYYQRLIAQAAPRLGTPEEPATLDLLQREMPNLRGALRWALTGAPLDALRLAADLGAYWVIRPDRDAATFLRAALHAAGAQAPAADRAISYLCLAQLDPLDHEFKRAQRAAEAALTLYRQISDNHGIAKALSTLSAKAGMMGDRATARRYAHAAVRHAELTGDDGLHGTTLGRWAMHAAPADRGAVLEQARSLLQPAGSSREIARAYSNVAYIQVLEGRADEAIDLLEVALSAARHGANAATLMFALGNMGLARLLHGEHELARDAFEQQLRICLQHGFAYGADEGLTGLAAIAAHQHDQHRAATLYGAATSLGWPAPPDQPLHDALERQFFALARATAGTTAWHRGMHAGEQLTLEDAIRYGLQPRPAPSPTAAHATPDPSPPRLKIIHAEPGR
jgi:predicted ATPase/DNA-binding SARP family transcriptional activator